MKFEDFRFSKVSGSISKVTDDNKTSLIPHLQALDCGGTTLYYFESGNNQKVAFGKEYNFHYTFMYIPKFFSPVMVEVDRKKEIIRKAMIGAKNKEAFAGPMIFCVNINSVEPAVAGNDACPATLNVRRFTPLGASNLEEDSNADDGFENGRNMLFHWNKHYFYPLMLANGTVIYYAFESLTSKDNFNGKLMYKLMVERDARDSVEMNSPLYFDNILDIFITKNINY